VIGLPDRMLIKLLITIPVSVYLAAKINEQRIIVKAFLNVKRILISENNRKMDEMRAGRGRYYEVFGQKKSCKGRRTVDLGLKGLSC